MLKKLAVVLFAWWAVSVTGNRYVMLIGPFQTRAECLTFIARALEPVGLFYCERLNVTPNSGWR